jgi:uncharacterized protein YndB with AHSA1/START domain
MPKDAILFKEITIAASLAQVWDAWTTEEGLRFVSDRSNVELRPGGPYEWFLELEPDAWGRRGGEGARILDFEPRKSLEFTWTFPPAVPELRESHATTNVRVEFEAIPTGTRIRFTQRGWQEGESWDAGFAYFDRAWDLVFEKLRAALETGA